MAYLENELPNINSVYLKAIVAYALALADSPQKLRANQDLLDSAIYDPGMNCTAIKVKPKKLRKNDDNDRVLRAGEGILFQYHIG